MQMSEPLIPVQNPPNYTIFILWFVREGASRGARKEKHKALRSLEEEEGVLSSPELAEGVPLALGLLQTFPGSTPAVGAPSACSLVPSGLTVAEIPLPPTPDCL